MKKFTIATQEARSELAPEETQDAMILVMDRESKQNQSPEEGLHSKTS